jgi:hypothetical protein
MLVEDRKCVTGVRGLRMGDYEIIEISTVEDILKMG